jgi:acetyl xylan esterase AXE1
MGRVDVRRKYVESVGLGFSHVPSVPNPPLKRQRTEASNPIVRFSPWLADYPTNGLTQVAPQQPNDDVLPARQKERRKELWGLLGDLPWGHKPGPAKLVSKEEHEDYVLERLVLDLNSVEPVPALLLIPRKRQTPAPGLLYIHWHGGMYDLGKEMLLKGVQVAPAYAPVCAEKGLVTLAIDSWCFGERKHEKDGHEGEENAFKLMLWKGQVLYGMMMFDEFRAMDYLASRPEVDDQRLGALGMSMGSTKAWWLAALDPRVKLCMDVCCLTDYEELIKAHGLHPRLSLLGGHGNGALLQGAIPGRQYLSPGHGHPLCAGLSLLQVLLHPLPLYNALPHVFDPAFGHLHFRPQGRPQDSSRQTTSLSCPPEKDRTFSRGGRGTSPPQANPFGNTALAGHPRTRAFHGHRYRGCGRLGKNGKLHVPLRRAD